MVVIAIDGPAGAGKSTVASGVAVRTGIDRLDTGAMYRAVTLAVLRAGADPADGDTAAAVARRARIDIGEGVLLDSADVTDEVRSPHVDAVVSLVASHAGVRAELVRRQREWVVEHGGGVVEGRDIGSVVLPDADLKVYLTAAPEVRARRRAAEDGSVDGADVEQVAARIAERDRLDSGRVVSPLVVAADAHVIDSTGRSVDEVVEEVMALL